MYARIPWLPLYFLEEGLHLDLKNPPICILGKDFTSKIYKKMPKFKPNVFINSVRLFVLFWTFVKQVIVVKCSLALWIYPPSNSYFWELYSSSPIANAFLKSIVWVPQSRFCHLISFRHGEFSPKKIEHQITITIIIFH